MARDPVCGMTVEPATAAGHAEYEGETYHFCSLSCRDRFRAAPAHYVKKVAPAGAAVQPSSRRSLPMMQAMPAQEAVSPTALAPDADPATALPEAQTDTVVDGLLQLMGQARGHF